LTLLPLLHPFPSLGKALIRTLLAIERRHVIFHPIRLRDQGPLQDDPTLLVSEREMRQSRLGLIRPVSAYLWFSSVANSYIQPSFVSQFLHETSRTMWRPVNMTRSWTSLKLRFTTLLNRKALPVAPVKRVEMSSFLLVRTVSQEAQENKRFPPMCSRKIRPILVHVLNLFCSTICSKAQL